MSGDAGARKADGGPGPIDQEQVASYIAELSAELAHLARLNGLDTLGFILDMAKLEAENVVTSINGRR